MIDEDRITTLHEDAMENAHLAARAVEMSERQRFYRLAFLGERDAAEMLERDYQEEPTRSILYRSAASLARDCGEYAEAARLISRGLSGYPPPDVEEELRELWDLVHFDRHLVLSNIKLERDEFELFVAGTGVAPGVVGDGFVSRYHVAQRLFRRIAEHASTLKEKISKLNRPFKDALRFYLVVAEPASFAVTIRVGVDRQFALFSDDNPIGTIIDEMIETLDIFQNCSDYEFSKRIPEGDYRSDLRQLLDQLAPDGKEIGVVGIARRRNGEEKKAAITRRRGLSTTDATEQAKEVKQRRGKTIFAGRLLFADDVAKSAKIILITTDGTKQPIMVAKGSMEDIVRPLWGKDVVVKVKWLTQRAKTPTLIEVYERNL